MKGKYFHKLNISKLYVGVSTIRDNNDNIVVFFITINDLITVNITYNPHLKLIIMYLIYAHHISLSYITYYVLPNIITFNLLPNTYNILLTSLL